MSVLEPLNPENGTELKWRAPKSAESTKDDHFEPYIILEFEPKSKQAALEWLTAKLQAPRVDGGAELLVYTNHGEEEEVSMAYVLNFMKYLHQNIVSFQIKLFKTFCFGFEKHEHSDTRAV